jgi:hypothetical protein
MQTLEFTPEELEVLREILQHESKQMEVELFRTDSTDFKQMLKHRRDVIEHLTVKVSKAPVSA